MSDTKDEHEPGTDASTSVDSDAESERGEVGTTESPASADEAIESIDVPEVQENEVQAESSEQIETVAEAVEEAQEDGRDADTRSDGEPEAGAAAMAAGSVAAATSGARPTDAVPSAIMDRLPSDMGPYLSLSRFDRPVGFWLLALPCFIGLAWARIDEGWRFIDIIWLALFGIGAVAMRGAGCTWNDIQDRHIDAKVERTKNRPLPSGQLSVSQAWMWLGIQLIVGFLVWIVLPLDAKIVALLAIPLVAAYPFMKRVTWWPQAWLGATMSWGVLVAAATAGSVSLGSVILWLGLACWVVGYDTIYALNDKEDDELVGVKSTARLFGDRSGIAVFGFYVAAAVLVALAAWMQGAGRIGAMTVLAFLAHGTWQVLSLRRAREARALEVFRSNTRAGLILFIGLAIAALFGYGNRANAETEQPAAATATPEAESGNWFPMPAPPAAPDTAAPRNPFGFLTPTPGEDAAPAVAPQNAPETEPAPEIDVNDAPREDGEFNPFGGLFGQNDEPEDAEQDAETEPAPQ